MDALFLTLIPVLRTTPPTGALTLWVDLQGVLWQQLPNQAPVVIGSVLSSPINYGVLPANTQVLSGQLTRQWMAANRKTVQNLESSIIGDLNVGSGNSVSILANIAFMSTGATSASRTGIFWQKSSGPCIPGSGHYHYVSWNGVIMVSWRFGFFTTLTAGTGIIGYLGTDGANFPSSLSWAPQFAGMGFKILADGTMRVYVDNIDASTHNLYLTSATVNVTGLAQCLVQEVLLISDGQGNVFAYLNNVHVGTFTGMQKTENMNNDCYPCIAEFNEPSGSATDLNFGIFPMEITAQAY